MAFDIVGPTIPSHVQFSVEASDGTVYCIRPPVTPGASWEVDLDDLVRDCRQGKPTAPDASSAKAAFAALHWTVIGTTNDSVPFDFCVENLRVHLE